VSTTVTSSFGTPFLLTGRTCAIRCGIRKEEIDRLFSLTKAQWEAMASDFFLPGYKVRYAKHKTGFQVIGCEVSTGFTFSLQPLYGNDTDPPVMVVIGNYFPAGRLLPTMTEKLKRDTEAVARQALGASYDVKLTYRQMGNIEALEFTLSKAERP
jgi:hypothetical protein